VRNAITGNFRRKKESIKKRNEGGGALAQQKDGGRSSKKNVLVSVNKGLYYKPEQYRPNKYQPENEPNRNGNLRGTGGGGGELGWEAFQQVILHGSGAQKNAWARRSVTHLSEWAKKTIGTKFSKRPEGRLGRSNVAFLSVRPAV